MAKSKGKAKRRLLMISYPFPPNSTAGAIRSERFARYLALRGWTIHAVTIRQRKDLFDDRQLTAQVEQAVTVWRTKTLDPWLWLRERRPRHRFISKLRSVLMRLCNLPDHMLFWIPFAVWRGYKICRTEGADIIYSTSPPHSTHLSAMILSCITGLPWVSDFRDPWTLNAYHPKGALENAVLALERVMEKAVLRKSSMILANTGANRNNLLKAFPWLNEGKVVHLPNGWEALPEDSGSVTTAADRLTIVHAGNFYSKFKPYGLLFAIDTLRRDPVLARYRSLLGRLRIVLLGCKDEQTRDLVEHLDLADLVEIATWKPLAEARRIMRAADLLWATLGTTAASGTYVPSKLFEYMAVQRPVIGFFHEGESARIIRTAGIGRVFTDDAPQPVLDFLDTVWAQKVAGRSDFYRPDAETIASYQIGRIADKLSILLEKAIDENQGK